MNYELEAKSRDANRWFAEKGLLIRQGLGLAYGGLLW